MLTKHRGQRPEMSLNVTLQTRPWRLFLFSFSYRVSQRFEGGKSGKVPHIYLISQVELHDRRGDSIPEGWGCDTHGKLSTDPKKVLNGGGLVPIGGSEATGPSLFL